MTLHVNDGGSWKDATPYVNDGGTWKAVQEVWVNDGGTWKRAYSALSFNPVPGTYNPTGQFNVEFTIIASKPVVWTYTKSGPAQGNYADIPSGTTASSISIYCDAIPGWNFDDPYSPNGANWTITATVDGQSFQWRVYTNVEGGPMW